MKTCTTCKLEKAYSEFARHPQTRDGRQSECRACTSVRMRVRHQERREERLAYARQYRAENSDKVRESQRRYRAANREKIAEHKRKNYRTHKLKYQYNITLADYQQMFDQQQGVCAGCQNPPASKPLAVDHDHACCPGERSCGKCIRGLLCEPCNQTLGRVRDDPMTLRRLASYLDSSRGSML